MANVARGTTYDWPAYVRDGASTLSDPQELTVEIRDAASVVQAGFPQDLDGTIVRDGVGQYHVPWAIPADQDTGPYYAYWTGVLDGAAIAGVDTINVVLPGAITPTEVLGDVLTYITPERYRASRLGKRLSGWSDLDFAELLSEASSQANSYCNVPLGDGFSFLGGIVTEEHTWRLPDHPFDPGQTRIYPRVWPVTSVDEVTMQLAANTSQTIPVTSFVKNDAERWIELSALVLTPGIFGISFFIFPVVALDRPILRVTMSYGKTYERTGERMYATTEGGLVYQAPDGYWSGEAPEIAAAGVTVDPGEYTIDRASGQVTFLSGVPTAPVTGSYATRIHREVALGTQKIADFLAIKEGNVRRGLGGGVSRVRVGEIEISSSSSSSAMGAGIIEDLAKQVPEAARLLNGHRFWRIA